LSKLDIPLATLDRAGKRQYPCICVDGADGFIELVGHVHQNGFTRFAFIGGPSNLVQQDERLTWLRKAMEYYGLPLNEKFIRTADLTSTGGFQAAVELLSLPDPPDAILCVNDETALGVLHAAHSKELEIGKQLAVAGFEGVQDAKHSEPPLTTLDIPVFDVARQLVRMLLNAIETDTVDEPVFIKPKLLVRASTGG
jgi:DNA-binding LacI/PurR family transcriptional regulator